MTTPQLPNSNASTGNSLLPITAIAPSLTNPRKTKNEDTFKEFVANIAKVGILQPVLVRPMPVTRTDLAAKDKTHELVFGHRRLAGAIAAGLQAIPVNVRELTDLEVLEIQIIENLQREDVHPLEEAEGYERLMQQINPATRAKYTAEEIGARIGKSRRYVYNRLKLLDLCPQVRKAFYEGAIDTSKAYLLARIDNAKVQLDAYEQIFQKNPDISVREAAAELESSYMLTLSKAPFDVKVASYADSKGKPIAGPCAQCPKRSGNNPDLFGDIKNADMCTDVTCFKAKTTAHKAIELKKATDAGKTVLDSKESAKVFDRWNPTQPKHGSGFKPLDAVIPGQPDQTFKKALGKELPTVVVQNPHTNKLVEVIDEKAATELLAAKGLVKKPSSGTSNNNPGARAHALNQIQLERVGRIEAWKEARAKFSAGLSEVEWRCLAKTMVDRAMNGCEVDEETFEDLMLLYQIKLDDIDSHASRYAAVIELIEKLPFAQIPRLLFELQHCEPIFDGYGTNETVAWFKDLFKRCDVSLDTHIQAARKVAKEKEAAEKKEAADKAKADKAVTSPDKKASKKA
jgi:ParB/RepB/Spo0J family partition protein